MRRIIATAALVAAATLSAITTGHFGAGHVLSGGGANPAGIPCCKA